MVWLIDDLAGAAFGPWGLAVATGVGVAIAARKRLMSTAAPAASGALAGGRDAGERAQDRVKASLAELGDWWSDLYTEARAEWEEGHSPGRPARSGGSPGRRRTHGASRTMTAPRGTASRTKTPSSTARRVRDASGRYVKISPTA